MEYDKPSDVALGTARQLAVDLDELNAAVEGELRDYAEAYFHLALAIGNTRSIIRKHLGPLVKRKCGLAFDRRQAAAQADAAVARRMALKIRRLLSTLPKGRV